MAYVDGFVLVVPKKNRSAYKKMANDAKHMWMKRGAIDYKECRIDDAKNNTWCMSFTQLVKPKKGEEVWFSYVVYKNKKDRVRINKEVQAGMEEWQKKNKKKMEMPFDMKRMAYGGFTVEVTG